MVPVHGAGWRAVVRVRLMHAAVRARLSCSAAYEAVAAADGVPINQIDMVVTQLAFSAVVVDGLERLGVDLSDGLEAVEAVDSAMVLGSSATAFGRARSASISPRTSLSKFA